MPLYSVVCCAADTCGAFQTNARRVAPGVRWVCVVCGHKQSITRVFFQSVNPKECRTQVQARNEARGAAHEARLMAAAHRDDDDESEFDEESNEGDEKSNDLPDSAPSTSRWGKYLSSTVPAPLDEDNLVDQNDQDEQDELDEQDDRDDDRFAPPPKRPRPSSHHASSHTSHTSHASQDTFSRNHVHLPSTSLSSTSSSTSPAISPPLPATSIFSKWVSKALQDDD